MEPLIDKTYEVKSSLYGDGCRLFQKKFVYPKNYVMTILCTAVIIYDIICFVSNTSDAMYIVVAFMCLVFAVSPWIQVYKTRMKLMSNLAGHEHDTYRVQIFNEYLTMEMLDNPTEDEEKPDEPADKVVKTEHGEFDSEFFAPPPEENPNIARIEFGSGVKIVESSEFFLVYVVNSVFYVIPKDKFSEEESLVMQKHFENRLGKNFSTIKQVNC